tara:strand:+ start:165 stop:446 length:282 start_codon:yes stop_codon:yes gene_type:complete
MQFIQDKTPLDINSIFHFFIPMGLGYWLKEKWWIGIIVLGIFEVIENQTQIVWKIGELFILSPETFINSLTDFIIGSVGLFIGGRLRTKKKLW